jgi:hypothetical protein
MSPLDFRGSATGAETMVSGTVEDRPSTAPTVRLLRQDLGAAILAHRQDLDVAVRFFVNTVPCCTHTAFEESIHCSAFLLVPVTSKVQAPAFSSMQFICLMLSLIAWTSAVASAHLTASNASASSMVDPSSSPLSDQARATGCFEPSPQSTRGGTIYLGVTNAGRIPLGPVNQKDTAYTNH